MLVEGLGSVTFVNGLLRVQLVAVDPSGAAKETGTIEIPGTRVAEIINGLSAGAQQISDKINETASNNEANKDNNGTKKDNKNKNKKKK